VPASRGGKARPRVHVDEIAFTKDVSHATAAGRRVDIDARASSSATAPTWRCCCPASHTD